MLFEIPIHHENGTNGEIKYTKSISLGRDIYIPEKPESLGAINK
jgi:hypothetical protein